MALQYRVTFFFVVFYILGSSCWLSLCVCLCSDTCVCVSACIGNWYFCRFFGFSIVIYRTDDDDDYDSNNDEGRIIFSDILRVCFRSIISTALWIIAIAHGPCFAFSLLTCSHTYSRSHTLTNRIEYEREHTNLYFRIDFYIVRMALFLSVCVNNIWLLLLLLVYLLFLQFRIHNAFTRNILLNFICSRSEYLGFRFFDRQE